MFHIRGGEFLIVLFVVSRLGRRMLQRMSAFFQKFKANLPPDQECVEQYGRLSKRSNSKFGMTGQFLASYDHLLLKRQSLQSIQGLKHLYLMPPGINDFQSQYPNHGGSPATIHWEDFRRDKPFEELCSLVATLMSLQGNNCLARVIEGLMKS